MGKEKNVSRRDAEVAKGKKRGEEKKRKAESEKRRNWSEKWEDMEG